MGSTISRSSLATASTRRSALGRAALGALALIGLGATRAEAKRRRPPLPGTEPIAGGWYGFCGHYFTTAPARARTGCRASTGTACRCGRTTAAGSTTSAGSSTPSGLPVDERGRRLIGPDGEPLPRAPRTRICEDWVPERLQRRRRHAGLVVPLLRRARAAARGLLLDLAAAHQRRRGPARLLRQGPTASSASCTRISTSRADDARHRRRGPDRGRLRRLVALRAVDDLDDQPRRVRGTPPPEPRPRRLRGSAPSSRRRCSAWRSARSARLAGADRLGVALAVGALALVAAARESGLVRLPLPQVRRQVPERWRREWPLPALERGLRRRPGPRRADAPGGRDLLGGLRRRGLARRAGCRPPSPWPRSGPAAPSPRRCRRSACWRRGRCCCASTRSCWCCARRSWSRPPPTRARRSSTSGRAARTTRRSPTACSPSRSAGPAAGVVVAPPNAPRFTVPGAAGTALDEGLLAYRDAAGIVVVDWHTGTPVARVDAPGADRPALDWPWLAYRRPRPHGAPRAGAARPHDRRRARSSPSSSGATTSRARPSARAAWRGPRSPAPAAPCACWPCPGARPTCCAAAAASC